MLYSPLLAPISIGTRTNALQFLTYLPPASRRTAAWHQESIRTHDDDIDSRGHKGRNSFTGLDLAHINTTMFAHCFQPPDAFTVPIIALGQGPAPPCFLSHRHLPMSVVDA